MRRTAGVWNAILIMLLVLMVAAVPVATSHAQTSTATATVNSFRANAWAGPGKGFWPIGILAGKETVPVTGMIAGGQWWQVNTRFGLAYVFADDVTVNNGASAPLVEAAPNGTITAAVVTIRKSPGIGARRLGTASRGMQFYLLARQADSNWIKIKYRYGTGWINGLLTSIGGEESAMNVAVVGTEEATMAATMPATPEAGVAVTQGPIAIVNTGSLNVRTGPGTDFKVIGTLSGGDMVSIVGRTTDGSWIQVKTDFGTGWVNIIFVLTRNYFGNAPVTEGQAVNAEKSATVIVLTGTVNVRSGPNVSFPSILTVNAGTKLPILGQSPDRAWWQVDTSAGKGWISKALVEAKGAVSSVPVVQP